MVKGIKQTDERLIEPIRKYGCYFLCLADSSSIVFEGDAGCNQLNGIWSKAVELGYISGDLNHDGDFDDAGEAEIQKATELARKFFKLKVRYDGIHHAPDEIIPEKVKLIFGFFFWKGGHFVRLAKNKKVTYDSYGKSNTVANGYLKSTRWFYAD